MSRDVDLLLIVKTGNGKSSTTNSILGRRAFKTSASSSSVTKHFSFVEYNGRVIKVVDGPGVGDTDLSGEEGLKLYPDFIEELMSFIRNKEVSKFFNFLTEKSLEHAQFVDSAFDDKCTLLMSASYHGQKDIVQKLLDIGCNVNLKNDSLWTALMFAAYSGHDDIVKMLLEKHADIDTVNSLGSTALHLATCMGHTNVFRVLLKENANIHIKDNAGWTVGLIAKTKGFQGIVQLMADYEKLQTNIKKCIRDKDHKGFSECLEEKNLKSITFLNSKFEDECTLLIFASHHGAKEIVDFLLDHGCEVNCKSSAGWTALMFAAHAGHEDIVQVLLDHKVDMDAVNNLGSTALHLATASNQISIVKLLLDRKANAEIKDSAGLTATQIANHKGFQSLSILLNDKTKWVKSQPSTSHDCKSSFNSIPLPMVHPTFLHSNSTSHNWAFSAIAELIDNAYDPDVRSSVIVVDKVDINDTPCLVFLDNGAGMDYDKLSQMLSFGFCERDIFKTSRAYQPIGCYGNGFKSGSMRLGKDALVFTRCQDSASVGFLSQTFLERTGADGIVVPIVEYTLPNLKRSNDLGTRNCLKAILEYSIYKDENTLLDELKNLGNSITGTKIIIYNLKLQNGLLELDFASDPKDIRCPEVQTNDRDSQGDCFMAAQTSGYKTSLRDYCTILYLRPRMQIILRGYIVKSRLVAKSLHKTKITSYKPRWLNKTVNISFGFSGFENNSKDYGMMLYHRNRLIKAYEKVGYQKQPNEKGVGVVGVAEVDFLTPTHNKQDFIQDEKFMSVMTAFGKKLNDYWNEHEEGNESSQTSITGKNPDYVWVQCALCLKWRRHHPGTVKEDLPDMWFCRMNQDAKHNRCDIAEELEEDTNFKSTIYRKGHKTEFTAKKTVPKKRASNWKLKDNDGDGDEKLNTPIKRKLRSSDIQVVDYPFLIEGLQSSTPAVTSSIDCYESSKITSGGAENSKEPLEKSVSEGTLLTSSLRSHDRLKDLREGAKEDGIKRNKEIKMKSKQNQVYQEDVNPTSTTKHIAEDTVPKKRASNINIEDDDVNEMVHTPSKQKLRSSDCKLLSNLILIEESQSSTLAVKSNIDSYEPSNTTSATSKNLKEPLEKSASVENLPISALLLHDFKDLILEAEQHRNFPDTFKFQLPISSKRKFPNTESSLIKNNCENFNLLSKRKVEKT